MRNAARLFLRYVAIGVRAQLQYRVSTILLVVGQLLVTGAEFLAIWALFDRFGNLRGYSLPEVALLYGMANVSFGLGDALCFGFDQFATRVRQGDFDRMLLRPRRAALQVVAQGVQVFRIGRLLQGAAVLVWALVSLDVAWTAPKAMLLVASLLAGAATFSALFVVQATISFWTTETLEVMATVTYGGVETAQYPLSIYRPWFRRFFTFVVPLAFLNYVPAMAILGRPGALGFPEWVAWCSPLAGAGFLWLSFGFWGFGVRRYRSTGS